MLETAVNDSAKELGLQEEITETGRVDTDIGTLLVLGVLSGLSLGGGRNGVDGLDDIIILIVVNEIVVVVGHDGYGMDLVFVDVEQRKRRGKRTWRGERGRRRKRGEEGKVKEEWCKEAARCSGVGLG